MKIPIYNPEDLGQFLDKPIRVYYHGGQILAIGVFHGAFQKTTEMKTRGMSQITFVLCFGQTNWELPIEPHLFHMHDIQIEEIKEVINHA